MLDGVQGGEGVRELPEPDVEAGSKEGKLGGRLASSIEKSTLSTAATGAAAAAIEGAGTRSKGVPVVLDGKRASMGASTRTIFDRLTDPALPIDEVRGTFESLFTRAIKPDTFFPGIEVDDYTKMVDRSVIKQVQKDLRQALPLDASKISQTSIKFAFCYFLAMRMGVSPQPHSKLAERMTEALKEFGVTHPPIGHPSQIDKVFPSIESHVDTALSLAGWIKHEFLTDGKVKQFPREEMMAYEGMTSTVLEHYESAKKDVLKAIESAGARSEGISIADFRSLLAERLCHYAGITLSAKGSRLKEMNEMKASFGISFEHVEAEERLGLSEEMEKGYQKLWDKRSSKFGERAFDEKHFTNMTRDELNAYTKVVLNEKFGYEFEEVETSEFTFATNSKYKPKTTRVAYCAKEGVIVSPDIDSHGGTVFKIFRKDGKSRNYIRLGSADSCLVIARPDTDALRDAASVWNKIAIDKAETAKKSAR